MGHAQLAIRNLKLIDARLAGLAPVLGLQLADLDTPKVAVISGGPSGRASSGLGPDHRRTPPPARD